MTAPLKRYCMVVSTVSATGGQRRDVKRERSVQIDTVAAVLGWE